MPAANPNFRAVPGATSPHSPHYRDMDVGGGLLTVQAKRHKRQVRADMYSDHNSCGFTLTSSEARALAAELLLAADAAESDEPKAEAKAA